MNYLNRNFFNIIRLKSFLTLPVTMTKHNLSDYSSFREVLKEAQNIVVLTGAGVSAESGIPTFRGPGGLWRTHRAVDLATMSAFRANPALVWEFYHYRREVAFNAQPNKAHITLAKYEQLCKNEGRKFDVITQNIDGLHQRAGSENVLELHGALTHVKCMKCKRVEENLDRPICAALKDRGDPAKNDTNLPLIDREDLPKCKHCNFLVRPYIVWFNENLERHVIEKSRALIESCDLCLIIGTSSVVYPAAAFAPMVARRGKPVAEFNLNATPAEESFEFYFDGPCGTTLPKALGLDV